MISIEDVAKSLKIDESKAYEALPAVCTILEKSELVDYIQTLGTIDQAAGMKIIVRIVARMKEYEAEIQEVLEILFGVDISTMSGSEKMELIKAILLDKDLTDFF